MTDREIGQIDERVREGDLWLADAERMLAELKRMRTVPPKLRIEGSWLVEEVDYHTCGQGESGHYGAHEPDCGLIPLVDLSDVPGWPK